MALLLLLSILAFEPFPAMTQMAFSINEGGDNRNPLVHFDIPYVPEEFRSSPKRIIFDKNDFLTVNLLPDADSQSGPLKETIFKLIQQLHNAPNHTQMVSRISEKIDFFLMV